MHHNEDARNKFTTNSSLRQPDSISRNIERRAIEKVQQLQKLGINLPEMMSVQTQQQQQQHQQLIQQQPPPLLNQQLPQIKPLLPLIATVQLPATSTQSSSSTATATSDENLTINLSNFTSPVLVNARYTEQMQKKKLIWGSKKDNGTTVDKTTTNNKWETARFSQDTDGKVASKFLRLMGMKTTPNISHSESDGDESTPTVDQSVQKREEMFSSMEQQYEVARQVTHTMRGMGLGFGSQTRPY